MYQTDYALVGGIMEAYSSHRVTGRMVPPKIGHRDQLSMKTWSLGPLFHRRMVHVHNILVPLWILVQD